MRMRFLAVLAVALATMAVTQAAQAQFYRGQRGAFPGFDRPYLGPEPAGDRALVNVRVPATDATVWFEDSATEQKGTERRFVSPALEAGKTYYYTVKCRWMEDGGEVTREKRVDVQPGRLAFVSFDDRQAQPRRAGYFGDRARDREPQRGSSGEPMTGLVVNTDQGNLVMTDLAGKNEHMHRLAAGVEVSLDGKKARLEDLKPGMQIEVLTDRKDREKAIRIKASTKARSDGERRNDPGERQGERPLPPA